MGRIVVDAQLVTDALSLTDAMKGDPRAWRISDVVMKVVAGRPSRHWTLFIAISQTAGPGLL